jgi:hypothetical protein
LPIRAFHAGSNSVLSGCLDYCQEADIASSPAPTARVTTSDIGPCQKHNVTLPYYGKQLIGPAAGPDFRPDAHFEHGSAEAEESTRKPYQYTHSDIPASMLPITGELPGNFNSAHLFHRSAEAAGHRLVRFFSRPQGLRIPRLPNAYRLIHCLSSG